MNTPKKLLIFLAFIAVKLFIVCRFMLQSLLEDGFASPIIPGNHISMHLAEWQLSLGAFSISLLITALLYWASARIIREA